jgi:hypothetical protein
MLNPVTIITGAMLAGGLILAARRRGSYRSEKIAYAAGLIVAALIYVGFGLYSGSALWNLTEFAGLLIYTTFAVLGLRLSGWFLCFGWALHVGWDVILHGQQTDFVPFWYQMLCLGFDLQLAGYIGFREWRLK